MPRIWLPHRQEGNWYVFLLYSLPLVIHVPQLANFHITTLGHGYNSQVHVDHNRMFMLLLPVVCTPTSFIVMNLSHVITEFSFGKHFPEITQPLDNSVEIARDSASFAFRMRTSPDIL
jgi:endoplasmic reticulum-Golgi intermediate compartment protein 2